MEDDYTKFLNGFRFILALWVALGHFYMLIGGVDFYKFPHFVTDILMAPSIAVYGFMIITGFLMMYNYLLREKKEPVDRKSTYVKFWMRRFFRLYPLYLLLIIVAFFSLTYTSDFEVKNLIFLIGSNITTQWGAVLSSPQPGFWDLATHIFLIHGLFPNFHDSILGVTWSLSLEMQFYFLFPFIFLLFFKDSGVMKKRLILLSIVCTFLSIVSTQLFHFLCTIGHLPDFKLPSVIIYMMHLFLLGMIIAGVKLKKIRAVYLVIILFLILPFQLRHTSVVIGLLLLFFFLGDLKTVVPVFIFKALSAFRSLFSGKIAEFGADISYSLYLTHTIVIPVVIRAVILNANVFHLSKKGIVLVSLIITLVVCFSICAFLYRFIEKPFISLGKKVVSKIGVTGDKIPDTEVKPVMLTLK